MIFILVYLLFRGRYSISAHDLTLIVPEKKALKINVAIKTGPEIEGDIIF